MPRLIVKLLPVFLFVFFCLLPTDARADAIVITSGSLTASGPSGDLGAYSFNGGNFSISGRGSDFGNVSPANCFPCRPGDQISLNSLFVGDSGSLGSGAATINGVSHNRLYYSGQLRFTSGPIILPVFDDGIVNITIPFTFEATLQGCTGSTAASGCPSASNTQIFSTTLSGQGLALLQLSSFFDPVQGRTYSFRSITYQFAPQPTPEPATLLLLGTGLAGAYYRRRRALKN